MTDRPDAGDVARFSVSVRPPAARSEVRVERGALARLPALLADHAMAARYVVVSDETVAALHGRPVADRLRGAGLDAALLTFPAGEANKTMEQWARVVEALGDMGMGRDGCVVAVGGGVTGDLAGFAAAAFARGVALVQVPTTLLAMVDASMGGKTGVDLAAGKNLAGAWHHPRLIVMDPDTLDTLPAPVLANGFAETVKHGAIADAAYLAWIASSAEALLRREPAPLDRLIAASVRIKIAIVERDAHEAGERASLNFGHTVGHAIERASDYSIPHGDAVAIGMVAEARIGEGLRVTAPGTADRLAGILASFRLPVLAPPAVDVRAVLAATRADKKARRGAPRYVLLRELGAIARPADGGWTHAVGDDRAAAALVPRQAPVHGPDRRP